jgi:restriction system protein
MSRHKESPLEVLIMAPWWVSAALAVVAFVGLRWGIPAMSASNPIFKPIANGFSTWAPLVALLFGGVAVTSALFAAKRRSLVDTQRTLETLRATSWKDFEILVAEAYRRRGFAVDYSLGKGPDGGVDLVLRKDGRTSLVQCKQWKVFAVGAPVIRELFGILTANGADEAIIVTTGRFTDEARDFAAGQPIRLLDGPQLLELVKSVQANPAVEAKIIHMPAETVWVPKCPKCGSEMVLRTARRGAQAGDKFWGCSTYPRCKGTQPA